MTKKEAKGYYAVVLSVGYGIFENWKKVKALQSKGFHKNGSNFFQYKKFDVYFEAVKYALNLAAERCNIEKISVPYLAIPIVPNQLFFYSRMGYLKPEDMAYLQQRFNGSQYGNEHLTMTHCVPINLVEFDN